VGETIVPVAVEVKMEMFYATTARGWKSMDFVFFLMDPNPCYEMIFLDPLPQDMSCAASKRNIEGENYIQKHLSHSSVNTRYAQHEFGVHTSILIKPWLLQ
jgi:glycerol-3-phosphate acyltransferase